MCHHANTHGTQPYVALNNLHVVAGDGGGYSAERELSPNLSQSSHSVCYACRQPRFLMRLTQLPCTHLSVFLISQSGRRRTLVHHPTTLSTSPVFPLVDTESSVKGRPLRPLHLGVVLGHCFDPRAAPISMTNMWLLMDDLPLFAPGRSEEQRWMHAEIILSPRTPCSCFIISRSSSLWGGGGGLCLVSFMDQWGDAHQQMWHIHWREHCVWHERQREQHLAPYHIGHPACGEINVVRDASTCFHMALEEKRKERIREASDATCAQRQDTWFNSLSQLCSVASHTQFLWSFVPTLCSVVSYLPWVKLRDWNQGEHCGLNPADQDGGYTVHLRSVVYNVICTFNLHLGGTLYRWSSSNAMSSGGHNGGRQ